MNSENDYIELNNFIRGDLTATLSGIECAIEGVDLDNCPEFLSRYAVTTDAIAGAYEIKKLAGQINVTIHALGILSCLSHLLLDGERVESVSLGAGNTGRKFDLETNLRIAEFKFINWRGGAESIRQNGIFKDFFELAQEETHKKKYLYLLGTEHPLKFFNGGRSLESVLSKNDATKARFEARYGSRYSTVRQYFEDHRDEVIIHDASRWLPQIA